MADIGVTPPEIAVVAPGSPTLADVRALWRRHSDTLGFFPDSAFDDHARSSWILAATSGARVVGYLLYRITGRSQAAIVHLCVAEEARGSGLASLNSCRGRPRRGHGRCATTSAVPRRERTTELPAALVALRPVGGALVRLDSSRVRRPRHRAHDRVGRVPDVQAYQGSAVRAPERNSGSATASVIGPAQPRWSPGPIPRAA